ncbi:MAG: isochorismatase family protein [Acidimicrobiia bacterium]|nr:isochorismatase family protein [Acidimicrobiia bacterium]
MDPVSEAMALVTLDAGTAADRAALRGLTDAFRAARLPVVHAVLADDTSSAFDQELLDGGGVQTLGRAEMAIGLRGRSAFDATPLDALLRSLGVDTVVLGGPVPSPAVSASVAAGELRGYRVLLATDELAVTLGAYLRAA